jgi:membrane-associated phospholipid phosphatase
MARVLRELPPGFWPQDKLILGYFGAVTLLIAAFFSRVPGAAALIGAHLAGAALILAAVLSRPDPLSAAGRLRTVFRYWYPLPFVASCYKEMAILIPPIRGVDYDALMAGLDRRVWGADPTVWLERISNPLLTEVLQWAYSLFVPAVMLVAALLWIRHGDREFRYYAFLISLGFLTSYVGYFMVPVRGPRFFLAHLQHFDLRGLWLFNSMQQTLDRLESAHYDCFPSGHTELTLLAWWGSRMIGRRLFLAYTLYAPVILLATVYLRYHYTIDVLAGAALAAALLVAAPHFYRATRASIGGC